MADKTKKHHTFPCSAFILVEITGPIQITVTLLQSMHGSLPNHLETHPQKSVCEWV